MAHKLEDIRPRRVSLVKRGANLRRVLLAKSDGDVDADVVAILEAPVAKEDALLDAVRANDGDETVEKAASTVARALDALRGAWDGKLPEDVRKAMDDIACDDDPDDDEDDTDLEKAYAAEVEIYKRDVPIDERKKLAEAGNALPDGSYPIASKADIGPALTLAQSGHGDTAAAKDLIKRRAKELGATDQLPDDWVKKEDGMTETAQAVPVKKEDGSWDLSAVPEEQRSSFEAILKAHDDELVELRKEKEDAETTAQTALAKATSLEERIEKGDFVTIAKGLDKLAKSDDEFGEVLYAIRKAENDKHLPEGTFEKLETVLKAANEAVAKGDLFTEIGHVGGAAAGDAEQRLEKAAEELRKAEPKLTKEQSIAKALDNDKSLYDEIRKEQ